MISLTIDHKKVDVPEGTTVLQAARKLGVEIPTMCYLEGYENRASCLLCMVKDNGNGKLSPSCALPASNGMDIVTQDAEVYKSRKQALELLLSDHVGDCEAPCRMGCPAFINIPKVNRLITEGNFIEAYKLVQDELAMPLVLGHICEAPCEKVCRREEIDTTVSICQLIKFVAKEEAKNPAALLPEKENTKTQTIAIVGSGPAGLTAAFHLLEKGYSVTIIDKNNEAGGSLRTEKRSKILPQEVLKAEIKRLETFGANFQLNKHISSQQITTELKQSYDAVLLASGAEGAQILEELKEPSETLKSFINPLNLETKISGVFIAGSLYKQQKMAVKAVAQGKEVALAIHRYLQGLSPEKMKRMFNSRFGKLNDAEKAEYMKEAATYNQLQAASGSLLGYQAEEAIKEAARCMHCDCRKVDNCKLRIYADEYQADRRHFLFRERKSLVKFDEHEEVIYEPEKCIRCSLCVEISGQDPASPGLTEVGRGFNVHIDVPFQNSIKHAIKQEAEACVRACPTAALSFKEAERNKEFS